jgi:hypothetical protein
MDLFKLFCRDFSYTDGTNKQISNCMDIYYNTQLVLSGHRLAFMIQPIDYTYAIDYSYIIQNILDNHSQIETKCHYQGTLIFLKKNISLINSILESSNNINDSETLGQALSYPCYNHKNYGRFINLYISDEYGRHQLIANYYNDDGSLFKNKIKEWVDYLLDNYVCYVDISMVDLSI